jgi:hypothetical protein
MMGQMDKPEQGCDWPYVLKPRWIHDLLLMWRRKEPYELYLDQAADYSVREVRDLVLRRRCVAWIANHFAPSRAAATLNQNVWASYSHHFQANELAPVYLIYLILCEPLARQATAALHGQITHEQVAAAMPIGRSHFGNVNAAPGALEAWLRTLLQWGVLAADPRRGGYIIEKRLCVSVQTFPLLVWSWWLDARQSSIPLAAFAQLPLWTWIECDSFVAGWQAYVGRLWTLEADGGEPTLFLHPTDTAGFTRSLLNLLSTDGRRGRQLPRHLSPGETLTESSLLGEGILGR